MYVLSLSRAFPNRIKNSQPSYDVRVLVFLFQSEANQRAGTIATLRDTADKAQSELPFLHYGVTERVLCPSLKRRYKAYRRHRFPPVHTISKHPEEKKKESAKTAQEPGSEQLHLGQTPSLSALLQALLCSTVFGCPSVLGVETNYVTD